MEHKYCTPDVKAQGSLWKKKECENMYMIALNYLWDTVEEHT